MASKRLARPDRSRCVSCGACVKVCPLGAISIWHGCHARVEETRCVGCGRCAKECPANCIALVAREEQAK